MEHSNSQPSGLVNLITFVSLIQNLHLIIFSNSGLQVFLFWWPKAFCTLMNMNLMSILLKSLPFLSYKIIIKVKTLSKWQKWWRLKLLKAFLKNFAWMFMYRSSSTMLSRKNDDYNHFLLKNLQHLYRLKASKFVNYCHNHIKF
jgi:hypothetical protein